MKQLFKTKRTTYATLLVWGVVMAVVLTLPFISFTAEERSPAGER